MKTKTIITLVVIAAVITGVYFYMKNKKASAVTTPAVK